MSRPLTKSEQAQVEAMLPMVKNLSFWFARQNPSVSQGELESVGREALVVAASRHQPELGPLEGFAFSWARGQMANCVRRTLQIKEHESFSSMWIAMGGRHDSRSTGELFDAMLASIPEDDRRVVVEEMTNRATGVVVELAGEGDPADHEANYLNWRATALAHQVIDQAQAALGPPESTVFKLLFQDELTLDAIATKLEISKKTVQRIADRIRAAITEAMRAQHIAEE